MFSDTLFSSSFCSPLILHYLFWDSQHFAQYIRIHFSLPLKLGEKHPFISIGSRVVRAHPNFFHYFIKNFSKGNLAKNRSIEKKTTILVLWNGIRWCIVSPPVLFLIPSPSGLSAPPCILKSSDPHSMIDSIPPKNVKETNIHSSQSIRKLLRCTRTFGAPCVYVYIIQINMQRKIRDLYTWPYIFVHHLTDLIL